MHIVSVLLPVALDQTYHYAVPEGLNIHAGDCVRVPFGKKDAIGCVWDNTTEMLPIGKQLKTIIEIVRPNILTHAARKTIDWMANYTLSPRGLFLRMCVKNAYIDEVNTRIDYSSLRFTVQTPANIRLSPQRIAALSVLSTQENWSREEILETGKMTAATMLGLIKAEILVPYEMNTAVLNLHEPKRTPHLIDEQIHAARAIITAFETGVFSPILLDGVTGSGKTEVYCEAVEHALKHGTQVLVLLPEIALTHAMQARFVQKFGSDVKLWHSNLGIKQKRITWQHILEGKPAVVVGARSALFLPFQNLKLIVVDEEHESSYKQEEGLSHNARDMAIVRAKFEACPIVLASATPSLETFHNAQNGKYTWLKLTARATGAQMPNINLLDMKQFKLPKGEFIAPSLLEAITKNLEAGHQSLLYLNRRGYSPLNICRGCGHKLECPSCTAWLVEHKRTGKLCCHHCGFETPPPSTCPSCLSAADFVACGPGVERIYEEIKNKLPNAKCILMSSDSDNTQEILQKIAKNDYNIIIGTQIMAKGHDFPNLTLVGVVDGDLGLSTLDLRAAERTFQVLQQVVGRSGRHATGATGTAIVQTYVPEHAMMQALAAQARDEFYERELEHRQRGNWPPFGRLSLIMISTPKNANPLTYAQQLLNCAPNMPNVEIMGPAEPSLSILRDRKRIMFTLHANKSTDLSAYIRQWLKLAPKFPHTVRVRVDIDPLRFE